MNLLELRPLQAMAASVFFRHKKLLLCLPRQKGGKTELGVRFIHDITRRPFTSSSLFLAKSKDAGKKATREKFMRIFDPKDFVVNTSVVYLKKTPTSVCFMDSVDKDPDKIRGGTHSLIHWSEVAFSKIDHGQSIASVFGKIIKPTLTETDGYVLLESTNNGKNGWHDIWEDYKSFGFHRLKVGLGDMVEMGLLPRDEYDQLRSETLPEIFKQEYECEWVTFQGRVYAEFLEAACVGDFPGPESWQTTIMGIDWGFHPSATCVLFGYVKGEDIFIFDEHYQKEEMPIHTAEAIQEKFRIWDIKKFAAAADHDPARIEELRLRGIVCANADKVNVHGVRMQIKEAFFKGRLFIHQRCTYLRKDLLAATWHAKKENEIDDSQCSWGHFDAEAALRYLIRELSSIKEQEPKSLPVSDDASMAAYEEILKRSQQSGD